MQTLLTMLEHIAGAGDAPTVGENELGPPGLMAFSVGDGAGELVEAGVVVVDGDSLVLELQPADSAVIPTIAAPPAKTATCRAKRPDLIACPICVPRRRIVLMCWPGQFTSCPRRAGRFIT